MFRASTVDFHINGVGEGFEPKPENDVELIRSTLQLDVTSHNHVSFIIVMTLVVGS